MTASTLPSVLMPLRAFSVFVGIDDFWEEWGKFTSLNALTGIQCIRRKWLTGGALTKRSAS